MGQGRGGGKLGKMSSKGGEGGGDGGLTLFATDLVFMIYQSLFGLSTQNLGRMGTENNLKRDGGQFKIILALVYNIII